MKPLYDLALETVMPDGGTPSENQENEIDSLVQFGKRVLESRPSRQGIDLGKPGSEVTMISVFNPEGELVGEYKIRPDMEEIISHLAGIIIEMPDVSKEDLEYALDCLNKFRGD